MISPSLGAPFRFTKGVKKMDDPLDIPPFLRISAADRKKAWEEHPPHKRIDRMIEHDQTLISLKNEYNKLGDELVILGGRFSPRNSQFENQHEAETWIGKVKSSIKAAQKAHAEMKSQPNDPPGLIKEIKMSEATTHTNGTAKKASPAKKPAAKKPAAKKTKSATGRFAPEAKIHVIAKENPRRPGTDVFKNFEKMVKSATVHDYVKAGGSLGSLHKCIVKGWAKVS